MYTYAMTDCGLVLNHFEEEFSERWLLTYQCFRLEVLENINFYFLNLFKMVQKFVYNFFFAIALQFCKIFFKLNYCDC